MNGKKQLFCCGVPVAVFGLCDSITSLSAQGLHAALRLSSDDTKVTFGYQSADLLVTLRSDLLSSMTKFYFFSIHAIDKPNILKKFSSIRKTSQTWDIESSFPFGKGSEEALRRSMDRASGERERAQRNV